MALRRIREWAWTEWRSTLDRPAVTGTALTHDDKVMTRAISYRSAATLLTTLLLLALVVSLSACGSSGESATATPAVDANVILGEPNPVNIQKPQETLVDTEGNPFNIRAATEGYVTLIYLGYTFCPDICPTEMAELSAAIEQLDKETMDRLRILFISVDPARDTQEKVRKWLDSFSPAIIGLIPASVQVRVISEAMGMAPPEINYVSGSYYTVSHAAYIVAFPASGTGSYIYPIGTPPSTWVHDLELMAAQS